MGGGQRLAHGSVVNGNKFNKFSSDNVTVSFHNSGLQVVCTEVKMWICTLGNNLFSDVALGEYSDRVTVNSSTDYDCSLTIEIFTYNLNTFVWESSGTQTYDMGSISWSDSEDYINQKIKFQISDLLQGYKPVYTKYAEK